MKIFDNKKAYYLFLLIRRSEEKIIELYDTDKIKSPVHLSIGQEAIAVGVSMAFGGGEVGSEGGAGGRLGAGGDGGVAGGGGS